MGRRPVAAALSCIMFFCAIQARLNGCAACALASMPPAATSKATARASGLASGTASLNLALCRESMVLLSTRICMVPSIPSSKLADQCMPGNDAARSCRHCHRRRLPPVLLGSRLFGAPESASFSLKIS
ncbi:hypothetical protein D9M68_878690 [compost metagenome]